MKKNPAQLLYSPNLSHSHLRSSTSCRQNIQSLTNSFPCHSNVRNYASCHFVALASDSLFPETTFLYTSLLCFLLFKKVWQEPFMLSPHSCIMGHISLEKFNWRNDSEKGKSRTVRLCVVWKAVNERNFPESSIKCSTFVILLEPFLKRHWSILTLTSELYHKAMSENHNLK